MSVTNDVAEDDVGDAALRQTRQRRDVFVGVGVPAAAGGELFQPEPVACAATIAGRKPCERLRPPSSLNIVTIATMSTLSHARSAARQQSLPPLHEIAAFGLVMPAEPVRPEAADRLLLRRSLFDGCALSHERRRHVDGARARMFLGDVRGEAIGRYLLPAEPAEGLTGRDVDALHSQQHEWLASARQARGYLCGVARANGSRPVF